MAQTRTLLLALLLGAPSVAAQQVASLQLSHTTVSLSVGGRQTVFATAYAASGAPVSLPFRWSSSDEAVVVVEFSEGESDFAELVARGPGTARVTVRGGGTSESVAVTVVGAAGGGTGVAAVLNIDPPTIQLLRGESRPLLPVFLRADGEPAAAAPVQWSSLSPSVASVDASSGVVVGISAGQGAVQVTAGTLSRVATVEVADAPFSFPAPVLGLSPDMEAAIQVVVPSQRNRVLPSNGLTWRSTNEQVVRVTPLGIARAVAPGHASIVVEGYGQVRELQVAVHRTVVFVDAIPRTDLGPVQVPLDGRQRFRVTSLAADTTEIPDAPVVWSVQDTTVASFDPATGEVTGRALGRTTLRAKTAAPGVEFTWQIEVIAGGIAVIPARAGIGVGDVLPLQAGFTTDAGAPLGPARDVQWTTENANVARVDGSGHVTGVAPGHVRISASTPWGRRDTTDLYVQGALMFTSSRTGSADLFSVDPGALDQGAVQITAVASNEVMGTWSPDGSQVVFASDRDGNFELYVSDADGLNARRLTSTPDADELSPKWTPDGRQIVYAAPGAGGRAQIWIMNADGTDARALTADAQGANLDPAVSPDGRLIAFSSTRDGNYDIYVMDRDGASQRPMLLSPTREFKPAWFPNGDLAFVQERTERGRQIRVVARQGGPGQLPQPISPADLAVTDFAISGRGDLLALEVATPGEGGRFERRILLLLPGGAFTELPRLAGEQQSSPAFRLPLTQ
jgi:uncharacterized protein YjdB